MAWRDETVALLEQFSESTFPVLTNFAGQTTGK
jgi:hypothetical protein